MASANSAGEPLQLNRSTSNPFTSRLITFQDVPANFPHGQDLVASYALENNYRCRTRDYVAIFRKGWSDPRTYITFSWAPRHAKSNTPSSTRCVRFPNEDLNQIQPSDNDFYEFVYVTKKKEIGGVSSSFTIGASWYNSPSTSSSSASNVSDQSHLVRANARAGDTVQGGDTQAAHRKKKESVESFEILEKTPLVTSGIMDNLTQDLAPLISSISQFGQNMFKIAVENSSSHVECRCTSENGTIATCTFETLATGTTSTASSSCGSVGTASVLDPVPASAASSVTDRPKSPQRRLYSQVASSCQEFAGSRQGSSVATELQEAAIDEPVNMSGTKIVTSCSQMTSSVHRAAHMSPEREPKAKPANHSTPSKTASITRTPPLQQRKSATTPGFDQGMTPAKLASVYESLRHAAAVRERTYNRGEDDKVVREGSYSRLENNKVVRERSYSREEDGEDDDGKRIKIKNGDSETSGDKATVEDVFNVRRQKSPSTRPPYDTPESSICLFDTNTLGLPSFTLAAAPQKCARNLREMFCGGSARGNTVTVSVKSKFKCKDCRKKMVSLRSLRARIVIAEKTISQLRDDMEEIDNTLSLKDNLLDELSCQLKNLLHENSRLLLANERLYCDNLKISTLTEEKGHLTDGEQRAAATKELREKVILLESEKDALMSLVTQYNTATEELMEQAKVADTRLRARQEEQRARQQQLDDIMYTMALQGYTMIIDANGNSIDLTTKTGTPVKLKGGASVTTTEETERYLATIALQEDAINSLHEECNNLRPQIGVAGQKVAQLEHMLKEERDSVNKLRRQIVTLVEQVSLQCNKESALSKLLVNEQNEKAELLQRHQEYQAILSDRIQNLKEALQSAQLVSLQKQMSLLCERCSGTCAANADLSSSSETALLHPQRVKRKTSADMASCCDNWSNVDSLIQNHVLPTAEVPASSRSLTTTATTPTTQAVQLPAAKAKQKRKASGNAGVSYAAVVAQLPKELTTENKSDHQCPGDAQPSKQEAEAPSCDSKFTPPSSSLPASVEPLAVANNSDSCEKQNLGSLEEALQQIRATPEPKQVARVVDDVTTIVAPPGDQLEALAHTRRSLKVFSTRSRKSNSGAKMSTPESSPHACSRRVHVISPPPLPPPPSGEAQSPVPPSQTPDPNVPTGCPMCQLKFHTSLTMEQFLKHLKQHN